MSPYRVIQWGTGAVGTHALRFVIDNPALELVGLKCHSPAKAGLTASQICGRPGCPTVATNEADSLLEMDADCVLYMPRDTITDPTAALDGTPSWVDEIEEILAGGKNVVSPIQSAMHWRHLSRGEDLRRRLLRSCVQGGSSVVFTGIDPGFTSDLLATCLSTMVGGVERVRTWEAMDYSTYDVMATGNFLGFGTDGRDVGGVLSSVRTGWGGSLWLMADALRVDLDDIVPTIDLSFADRDYETQAGNHVAAGTVGAVWWSLQGMLAGQPLLTINHITRIGPLMAPSWPNVGTRGGYRIEIDGAIPLRCDLPLGLGAGSSTTLDNATLMTASRCVSAVSTIVRAPPGYHTQNDLPLFAGWPSPGASRGDPLAR